MDQQSLSEDVERLVHWLVGRMHKGSSCVSLDDLIQEGRMAAIKAIKSYDESKKVKLTTWVAKVVSNRLKTVVHGSRVRGQFSIEESGYQVESRPRGDEHPGLWFGDNLDVLHKRLSPLAWGYVCESLLSGRKRKTRAELAKLWGVDWRDVVAARKEALLECKELLK